MNIFAKVIFTSNQNIKDEFLKGTDFLEFKKEQEIEIYSKKDIEYTKILIFCDTKNLEKGLNIVKESFEIIYFLSLQTSFLVNDLDLKENDVIIPNSFIDNKDNVFFIEHIIDKNYDLNSFGLILNGVCMSVKKDNINPDFILEIKTQKNCDIIDFYNFDTLKILKDNNLIDKSGIINTVGESNEAIYNGVSIALMQL